MPVNHAHNWLNDVKAKDKLILLFKPWFHYCTFLFRLRELCAKTWCKNAKKAAPPSSSEANTQSFGSHRSWWPERVLTSGLNAGGPDAGIACPSTISSVLSHYGWKIQVATTGPNNKPTPTPTNIFCLQLSLYWFIINNNNNMACGFLIFSFSLLSHRYSYISLLFTSRFIDS
jgi:hypothetical protein